MSITRLGAYSQVKGSPEKLPCAVATTENITLSGLQNIDGYPSLVAGDRVLVKNQNTASENGIYVISESTWERAVDMSLDDDVFTGTNVFVNYGDVNGGENFVLTTANPIQIGVTSLTFEQSTSGGLFVLDTGVGSTKRVDTGNCSAGDYSFTTGSCNLACADYSSITGGECNEIRTGFQGNICQVGCITCTTWSSYYNSCTCDYNYKSRVCVLKGFCDNVTFGVGQSPTITDGLVSCNCVVLGADINQNDSCLTFTNNFCSACFSTCSACYDCSFCVDGDVTSLFTAGKPVIAYMCNPTCSCSTIVNTVSSAYCGSYTCVETDYFAYTNDCAFYCAACVHCNTFNTICFSSIQDVSPATGSSVQSGICNRIESAHSSIDSGCNNQILGNCNTYAYVCTSIIEQGFSNPDVVEFCVSGHTCCSLGNNGFTISGACNSFTVSNVYNINQNETPDGCGYTRYEVCTCDGSFCCNTYLTCSAAYSDNFCADGNLTSIFTPNKCIQVTEHDGSTSVTLSTRVCSSSFVDPYTCVQVSSFTQSGYCFCNANVLAQYDYICNTYPSNVVPTTCFNHIITGCNNIICNESSFTTVSGYGNVVRGCNAYVFGCNIISEGIDCILYGNRLGAYEFSVLNCGGCLICVGNNGILEAAQNVSFIIVPDNGFCSTIRCGVSNTASSYYSISIGGCSNQVLNNACASGIFSGNFNTVNLSNFSVITGGTRNTIEGGSESSSTQNFIGGGCCNTLSGYGSNSAIVGGIYNCNTACCTFIGGGVGNCISANWSTIVGGFCNTTSAYMTSIGGGYRNSAIAYGSTVSGGYCNDAVCNYSSISGGSGNFVCSCFSSIDGGYRNKIKTGFYDFVGGGFCNEICGCTTNTISGGYCNLMLNEVHGSVIAGGRLNSVVNFSNPIFYAAIGGGKCNTVSSRYGTISGGYLNSISGERGFIGSGFCNIVYGNSSMAMGESNVVTGNCSGALGVGLSAACNCTYYFNNICTTGCTWSSCFVETSSCRFKENIQPIDSALLNLNKLQGVCYNKTGSCSVEIGLIAEEVAKVYPQVVVFDGEGNPSGISYGRLSAILLESVKDLSDKFDTLQKEMNSLKKPN